MMNKMTCQQLGGGCEKTFHASSFEEIAVMSKEHCMEMFRLNDEAHLKAMHEMEKLMQKPEAMMEWFEARRADFENLSDS